MADREGTGGRGGLGPTIDWADVPADQIAKTRRSEDSKYLALVRKMATTPEAWKQAVLPDKDAAKIEVRELRRAGAQASLSVRIRERDMDKGKVLIQFRVPGKPKVRGQSQDGQATGQTASK